MSSEELAAIATRNTYLIVLVLVLVGVQVAMGATLFVRILGILREASGLLSLTTSHAKLTDHTTRCATSAVNELREDIKVTTAAARESAAVAATVAVQAVNTASIISRENVATVLQAIGKAAPLPSSEEPVKVELVAVDPAVVGILGALPEGDSTPNP